MQLFFLELNLSVFIHPLLYFPHVNILLQQSLFPDVLGNLFSFLLHSVDFGKSALTLALFKFLEVQ